MIELPTVYTAKKAFFGFDNYICHQNCNCRPE